MLLLICNVIFLQYLQYIKENLTEHDKIIVFSNRKAVVVQLGQILTENQICKYFRFFFLFI